MLTYDRFALAIPVPLVTVFVVVLVQSAKLINSGYSFCHIGKIKFC